MTIAGCGATSTKTVTAAATSTTSQPPSVTSSSAASAASPQAQAVCASIHADLGSLTTGAGIAAFERDVAKLQPYAGNQQATIPRMIADIQSAISIVATGAPLPASTLAKLKSDARKIGAICSLIGDGIQP